VWTEFDQRHNLSKRNVNLILKILSDLRSSSNKKTLYYGGQKILNDQILAYQKMSL
jgi:hypothetical protein